ncbi:MAG: hypothetical protein NZM25_07860 [Leptospiraceae bacterium]|nr:hypothetical protein [Leptospiraceae bacterium]MDW8305515.1 hypothetical protein [Leptospiraceae bacterium]
MKVETKNYFEFYFCENDVFYLQSERHPLWRVENEDIDKLCNCWHAEDFALPLFLRTMGKKAGKVNYPPLARVELLPDRVKLIPLESFLLPHSELIFYQYPNKQDVTPLNQRGEQTIKKPAFSVQEIWLKQENNYWLLARQEVLIPDDYKDIYNYQNEPILSVKSLLDPNGGLERLMRDIQDNKWPLPRKGEMLSLLKILQAASPRDEINILANIRKDDPTFYELVEKRLITPLLVPYMSRNEVSKVLQNLDEKSLQHALQDKEQRELFRPFFSRNRFHDLMRPLVSYEKIDLWEFVLESYRTKFSFAKAEKKTRYFYAELTPPRNVAVKPVEFLNSSRDMGVAGYRSPKLYIVVEKYFQNLWIYPQIKKDSYRYLHFKDIGPGILILDDIPQRPGYVLFAGILAKEGYEAISVDIMRFCSTKEPNFFHGQSSRI